MASWETRRKKKGNKKQTFCALGYFILYVSRTLWFLKKKIVIEFCYRRRNEKAQTIDTSAEGLQLRRESFLSTASGILIGL